MARTTRIVSALALLALAAAAWLSPLDGRALENVDTGLKRALTSFAAARALNALISVAQGTEIAVEPAGVGVVLTPGQVLDPINDVVEQFSTLMLAASVSFGVQRLLITIGGYWAISVALSVLAAALILVRWRGSRAPPWLTTLMLAVLIARFGVPLAALGSEAGFRLFLQDEYQAGSSTLERSMDRFSTLSAPISGANAPAGFGERLRQWWSSTADAMDIGQRYEALKQVAGETAEQIVRLIVVFLLQTLLFPLALLWLLVRGGRALLVAGWRGR